MLHILPLKYRCFLFSQRTCTEKTTAKSSIVNEAIRRIISFFYKTFHAQKKAHKQAKKDNIFIRPMTQTKKSSTSIYSKTTKKKIHKQNKKRQYFYVSNDANKKNMHFYVLKTSKKENT